jgi:hypothetical protein
MNKRLITDLSLQGTNLVNIFNEALFGTTEIAPHSPTKTYNTGNLVLYFNTVTNKYELVKCNSDLVTGVYNPSNWDTFPTVLQSDGSIDGGEF